MQLATLHQFETEGAAIKISDEWEAVKDNYSQMAALYDLSIIGKNSPNANYRVYNK